MALPTNQSKKEDLDAAAKAAENLEIKEDDDQSKNNQEHEDESHENEDDGIEQDPENRDPEEKKVEPTEDKKKPTEEEDTDWKKRYADSTREAQRLALKNDKVLDAVDKAAELPEPTDDEMKKVYTDWDVMTSVEQTMAKQMEKSHRQFSIIKKATDDVKANDEWVKKTRDFADDPVSVQKFPGLAGKENEFVKFCNKDERKSIPLPELADWFSKTLTHNEPQRKSLMPTSTGGEKTETNNGIITDPTKAEILRKSNYREYQRMVKSGKIRISL